MKSSGIAAIPIMITGFASVDTAIEAMRIGAFEYIQKPFESDQIDHVLKKAIGELMSRGSTPQVASPANKPTPVSRAQELAIPPDTERTAPSRKAGIRRRLQRVGRSTLSLTLPKEWANKTSAKPGDEVLIELNPDGSVKIIPESMEATPLSQGIKIDEGESSPEYWLSSAITIAYDQGAESMTLKFKEEDFDEVRSILDRVLPSLSGLSIVDEGKGKVVLQCFIDVSKHSFSGLIRRMLLLEESMIAQIVEERGESPQKDAASSPKEIERVHNLILRQCFRAFRDKPFASVVGIASDTEAVSNIMCSYALLRISKRLYHLSMLQEKAQIPEGIKDVLSELKPIITGLVEANITSKPYDRVGKLTEDLSKLEDKVDTLLASSSKARKGSDDAQIHLMGLFLVTILQFTAQITESALLKRGSKEIMAEKHSPQ
jgi:phosphate uptake regulator